MTSEALRITGKGIAAVHMLPHVRPAEEPWNSIAEAIGADIDDLSRRLRIAEEALREIRTGKAHEDNAHPMGEHFSMAMRFHRIAKDALAAIAKEGA